MLWALCLAGRLLMYEEGKIHMLEWIKRHKVFVIICFVIIVIGVPFAIHCLFKIHPTEDYDFFVAEWSAGELLFWEHCHCIKTKLLNKNQIKE